MKLVNKFDQEIPPLNLLTVRLKLKDWPEYAKIHKLIREIEAHTGCPAFTISDSTMFLIQVHVQHVDQQFWKSIENIEVFVVDMRKI